MAVARDLGAPLLPRGAGSSQCGQSVGEALVIDHSKSLNGIVAFDREAMTATVQPGVVLDQLNAFLKPHDLWFPVDVSTSAQATIGGMAGNNSCGSRSIQYGNMVHNVLGIDAILADGSEIAFGPVDGMRRSGRSGAPVQAPARACRDPRRLTIASTLFLCPPAARDRQSDSAASPGICPR